MTGAADGCDDGGAAPSTGAPAPRPSPGAPDLRGGRGRPPAARGGRLRDRWRAADAARARALPVAACRAAAAAATLSPLALFAGVAAGGPAAAGGLAYALTFGLAAGAATLASRALEGRGPPALRPLVAWLVGLAGALAAWLDALYAASALRAGRWSPEDGWEGVVTALAVQEEVAGVLVVAGAMGAAALLARPEARRADLVVAGAGAVAATSTAAALIRPGRVPWPLSPPAAALAFLAVGALVAAPLALLLGLAYTTADRVAARRWPATRDAA